MTAGSEPIAGAVIVAAGSSSRMNGVDKQFYPLGGVPALARTLRAFCEADCVRDIVVVGRQDRLAELWAMCRELGLWKVRAIVKGGATRQASVFAGVRQLPGACRVVAVHDGARPFVTPELIEDGVRVALERGAACAAAAVRDTVKYAPGGVISATPSREDLYLAQTPQTFERGLYEAAMDRALARGESYTDDCQLVEAAGREVALSAGSALNFKLTAPEDLLLAQALAAWLDGA